MRQRSANVQVVLSEFRPLILESLHSLPSSVQAARARIRVHLAAAARVSTRFVPGCTGGQTPHPGVAAVTGIAHPHRERVEL